jgi:hypothetical protein
MTVASELFDAIESHALASGIFDEVNTAEPKAAPGTGITCAIWIQSIAPAPEASGLAATTTRIEFQVRLYTSFLAEPVDMIDKNLLDASIALMEDYTGDFGLSIVSEVRSIDLLGEHGTPMQADAGYLNADGKIYRVITITLPIVYNDLWNQVS